tara:strand:+ start:13 stop:843 length:831 start_codon:yes stop_codon:yes gene_type:complete
MNLIQGNCLEKMKDISDNSIDLLFCDLPYGQTSCKWDSIIDLELFWKEVNRICKIDCPMFFTCSTKFGVSLINSNPKNFRYDLVWVKSAPCGFLNAKKMPMKRHEMIYVFYRKLPMYNISSHKHKFLRERKEEWCDKNGLYGEDISVPKTEYKYDPPLPNSVIRNTSNYKNDSETYGNVPRPDFMRKNGESAYDPPLPNSLLEIKSEKRKHPTQKPTDLIKWCLKYYSNEGDTILDPTMGSGSTGVACKEMNRNFIGIEKDEKIFNVAVERINEIN